MHFAHTCNQDQHKQPGGFFALGDIVRFRGLTLLPQGEKIEETCLVKRPQRRKHNLRSKQVWKQWSTKIELKLICTSVGRGKTPRTIVFSVLSMLIAPTTYTALSDTTTTSSSCIIILVSLHLNWCLIISSQKSTLQRFPGHHVGAQHNRQSSGTLLLTLTFHTTRPCQCEDKFSSRIFFHHT